MCAVASLGVPVLVLLYWTGMGLANDRELHLPLNLIFNSVRVAVAAGVVRALDGDKFAPSIFAVSNS